MKLRLSKKGICISNFSLTDRDIEEQAITDLIKYSKIYNSKYGLTSLFPLDIESFVKEMWGVDITYSELEQTEEEESLGQFDIGSNSIVVDAKTCNHPGRISFTIAHEAGHLSLHKFLYRCENGKIVGYSKTKLNKNLERQADLYAASILAPKDEVFSFLKENSISLNEIVDLDVYSVLFQDHFGLSRHAMEIRLQRLNIGFKGGRYVNSA